LSLSKGFLSEWLLVYLFGGTGGFAAFESSLWSCIFKMAGSLILIVFTKSTVFDYLSASTSVTMIDSVRNLSIDWFTNDFSLEPNFLLKSRCSVILSS